MAHLLNNILRASVWLQASELAGTQQQLMELVERMFSSPAWRASPRQTELADALRALAARSAEVSCQRLLEHGSTGIQSTPAALPHVAL